MCTHELQPSTLRLTEYEQSILDGKMGEFRQRAMEFIARYAYVLGATELCEVSRATMFIGAQHYLDCFPKEKDYREIFSEFYLSSEHMVEIGEFSRDCKCQTCAAACDFRNYERTHLSKEFLERNMRYLQATKRVGVKIVESCTPYLVGWIPIMGEHFVSTESSNVALCNSVFGAMSNADGIEAAVCAGITGRIPKWGMHIRENRFGDLVFDVECEIRTTMEWDVLGYTVGRLLPNHAIPILTGSFQRPDINRLRQFFSSLAVTSAAEICHIVGVTPEAQTLQMALGGKEAKQHIMVTQQDFEESMSEICDPGSGEIDYVSIGCPHLALDELMVIADYLRGKRIKSGAELLIWTDYATKEMANVNGYTQEIEASGAYVLTGSCPIVMRERSHKHAKAMVMNGVKQACGIRHQTSSPVYYGDIFTCMDAAINGTWKKGGK